MLISLKHNTYLHPFLGYFWFKPFHIFMCFVFCDATYFLVAVSNKSNVISFHNNSVGCLFPYICNLSKIDLFVCARARVYWEGGGSLSSRIDSSLVLTTWTTCIPDTENTKKGFQQWKRISEKKSTENAIVIVLKRQDWLPRIERHSCKFVFFYYRMHSMAFFSSQQRYWHFIPGALDKIAISAFARHNNWDDQPKAAQDVTNSNSFL